MKKQRGENYGFTLAEVLLVLSVIGVVAALTIPTLIQKVNDDQYKVKWKKTYSVVSQIGTSLFSEYGGSLKGVCSDANCWKNATKNTLT